MRGPGWRATERIGENELIDRIWEDRPVLARAERDHCFGVDHQPQKQQVSTCFFEEFGLDYLSLPKHRFVRFLSQQAGCCLSARWPIQGPVLNR
jgi:hypothetical protein